MWNCCVGRAQYSVLSLIALQYTIKQHLMVGGLAIFQKLIFQHLYVLWKTSTLSVLVLCGLGISTSSCLLNKMFIESCAPYSSCMQPKESGAGLQKGSLLMGATENTESRRTKKLYALKQAIQSFFCFYTSLWLTTPL